MRVQAVMVNAIRRWIPSSVACDNIKDGRAVPKAFIRHRYTKMGYNRRGAELTHQ